MQKKDLNALRIDRHRTKGGGRLMRLVWPLLALAAALAVILWLLDFSPDQAAADKSAEDPALGSETVDSSSAQSSPASSARPRDQGREVLIASGYIVAHHRHSLGSKVTGRVEWIGVDKGDKVRKGDLLVKLDDREFVAQVNRTKADLAAAKARLAELEAGSRPEEVARAAAEMARTRADADNALREWNRLKSLMDSAIISQQELDDARARYQMADAAARVADREHRLAEIGPRKERIDQAKAEVAQAEAAVEYQLALLDATEIRAPVSGTILQRIAEVGEMITTSFAGDQGAKSAVVALADLNDLQVEIDISQTDFNKISAQQDCVMAPEAYPDRSYRCEIAEISPEADRQKATIQVKVQILEPDDFLRPDMDARVTFLKPSKEEDDNDLSS